VLTHEDEPVRIMGTQPNGKAVAQHLVENGIPGPNDRMLELADGLKFLIYLHEAFRGSRLWATQVTEMDMDDTDLVRE